MKFDGQKQTRTQFLGRIFQSELESISPCIGDLVLNTRIILLNSKILTNKASIIKKQATADSNLLVHLHQHFSFILSVCMSHGFLNDNSV